MIGSGMVRIGALLAGFAVGVQLARLLGVRGYGIYGMALSIVTIASIPVELGLSKLVTREVAAAAATHDNAALFGVLRWAHRTCWRVSVVVGATLAALAAVLILGGSGALGLALFLGIPAMPLMALSRIDGGALQGLHHITRGQIPANLFRPLFLSVLLFVAFLVGAMSAPMGMALNSVAAAAVYLIAHLWLSSRVPRRPPPVIVQTGRAWLGSAIPMALTDGMRSLQLELTTVLLGVLTIPSNVGLFRIAVVTATVAAAPLVVIAHATMPAIARLHASGDHDRLQRLVTFSAWGQTAGVVLLSLPLLVAPHYLLPLVFGTGFEAAADATRIVAAGQIMNAAFGPNAVLLNMTHQERRVTRAMTIALALNVATVLLLGRIYGVVGGAAGFVLSLLCWNVLTSRDAKRILGIGTTILGPRARPRS